MEPQPPSPRRTRQTHTTEEHTLLQGQAGLEFASAEELIRFDAANTPTPPTLPERVQDSVNREPPRQRSWWSRWFGR